MRFAAVLISMALWAMPVQAEDKVERLMQALQVDEVIDILRDEGNDLGQELQETFLFGDGGALFLSQVDRIYSADEMRHQVQVVFQDTLTDSQLDRAILFFESELGKTIVSLEISARVALADEAIEEMAQEAYHDGDRNSQRYKLVEEFIQVNNLIDGNVQNSISADYHFFRGLSPDIEGNEAELLAELLSQKDEIEQETRTWLYSFFLLAYQPLTEADIRENIAFSRTDTGKAVNDALFESFDRMFDEIYFQLGQAIAEVLSGTDL